MELQFERTALRCLDRIIREVRTEEVTQELKLPEGLPDIGRVLAAWGQVVLRSKEWRADNVVVSGGVMIWVLYAPEDGSDPRCVDTWLPFSMKWDVSSADREGTIRVMPLLRFADSRTLSARKIMVRAGIGAWGDILCPREVQICRAGEVPEDVQLLKRTYPVMLPRESGEKTFVLDEDLTIPGAAAEKLLSYTIQPEITDRKVAAGKLVFRGSGNLHLVYRCAEGRIRTCDFELPFSQFQELEEEHGSDARADLAPAVTSLELDLAEEGRLRLKCGLVCQYVVNDCSLLELTQDAYSSRRQMDITMEELKLPAILDEHRESIRAEQILPGQSGQVVDVTFLPDFPRQRHAGDSASFEIPGLFQVLYYGDDEALTAASARWEGRYELPAGADSLIHGISAPVGRPAAASGSEGMELTGQIQFLAETTAQQGIPMAAALELGELQEPDPARPSLILCRPKGEELWELAKRCGSTVDAIRRANKLEAEPEDDQILLIPVS
ncbi:MAG: DUF3794 domain-containing protein [Oscillospiraceae bacterium]|nr:DUF3794 domain-containing protein [Oscillospiraceae bacterium]